MTVSDFVGIAPGPLKIALSTHFPYTGFRAKLHPEILAATQRVGDQLELLGHTVVKGNPTTAYGCRGTFLPGPPRASGNGRSG